MVALAITFALLTWYPYPLTGQFKTKQNNKQTNKNTL